MLINVNTITGLFVGFRNDFNKGFNEAIPQWSKVATLTNSKADTNSYPFMGTFPKLREWIGDRQIKNAHLAMAQNMGGSGGSCVIHILEGKS